MYRDPDELSVEENIAKVERSAATRRSTIRRESTVRPGRYAHPSPPAVRELAEIIPDGSQPHRSPFVDANDEIQHLEAELERLRRHRILIQTRRGANGGLATVAPEDVAVYARNPTSDLTTHLPRESALRFELGPRAPRSGATSPRRHRISRDSWVNRRTLPSPPHSIESSGRVRVPAGSRIMITDGPEHADAGYTRDFAPARGPYTATPHPTEGMTRVIIEHNSENVPNPHPILETPGDTPPPESWDASYPPLRRVGRLSPRPRLSSDGLGDRRRSMSPGSPTSAESIVNEDRWETLLSTIDNDDLRPSHNSSFDSTRSNSEPDSNRSTQTAATSFGEIGSVDDTCDLDLPHGITEEVVREIRERHHGTTSDAHPSTNEVPDRSERRNNGPGSGTGMAMFQNLLTRLSQRHDISEEWWAAAGLARTIRENA
jgi:hypothetical protein